MPTKARLTLTGSWAKVTNGNPALVQLQNGSARIHVGSATPAADSTAFHLLDMDGERTFQYLASGENVYAKAYSSKLDTFIVVTET